MKDGKGERPPGTCRPPEGGLAVALMRYGVARVVPAIGNFGLIVLLARGLGATVYGELVVINATVGLGIVLGYGWLTSSAYRFYEESASSDERRSVFLCTVGTLYLSIGLLIGGTGALLVVGGAGWVVPGGARLFFAVIATFWGETLIDLCLNLARAEGSARWYLSTVSMLWVTKPLAVAGVLGLGRIDTAAVLVALALASSTAALPFVIHQYRKKNLRWTGASRGLIYQFIRYGVPVAGSSCVATVLALCDRYLIEHFLGWKAVGVYAASYQMASSAVLLPASTLMLPGFTVLIREYQQRGLSALAVILERLAAVLVVVALPALFCVILVAPDMLELLFGGAYREGATAARWVAIGLMLLAVSEYFEKAFQLTKRPGTIVGCQALALGLNVVLNLLLIPSWGLTGAGVATMAAYGVYLALIRKLSLDILRWHVPMTALGKATFAAFLGATVTLVVRRELTLPLRLLQDLAVFGGCYMVMLIAMREETLRGLVGEVLARHRRLDFPAA